MATELLDEHEQGELVRNWLRNNFGSIILGIAGGVGAIWGVGKYQDVQIANRDRAGQEYGTYLAAVEKQDADQIKTLGSKLRADFPDSPYAVLSAMSEAEKILENGGAQEDALASLRWAQAHADFTELKSLATLRLARALIDADKSAEVEPLLATITAPGFSSQAAELRGDVLLKEGKPADARAAYELALVDMDSASARRRFVEMKRDDIAVASSAPVAAAKVEGGS